MSARALHPSERQTRRTAAHTTAHICNTQTRCALGPASSISHSMRATRRCCVKRRSQAALRTRGAATRRQTLLWRPTRRKLMNALLGQHEPLSFERARRPSEHASWPYFTHACSPSLLLGEVGHFLAWLLSFMKSTHPSKDCGLCGTPSSLCA